jgi:predicted HicB family RNase H-like nuclease
MSDDVFGSASDGSVSSGQDTTDLQEDVSQEEMTQLNVEIPKSLHRRLKMHAAKHGRAIKDVVHDVLDNNLDI